MEAWEEGRPLEAVGRGTFEVIATVAGTKGLDKVAKGSKATSAVTKLDDVAEAASATAKTTSKVDDAARASTKVDAVAPKAAKAEVPKPAKAETTAAGKAEVPDADLPKTPKAEPTKAEVPEAARAQAPKAAKAEVPDAARATPNALGKAGEAAVQASHNIGPKVRIGINGRTRIPDGLTNTVLSEVKNVKSLSFTRQLRDFADFAGQTGRRFDLFVRPNTQLSGPLQQAVQQGTINLRFIP